jgi:hypothetical protein
VTTTAFGNACVPNKMSGVLIFRVTTTPQNQYIPLIQIVGGAFLSCDYNSQTRVSISVLIVGGANLSCDYNTSKGTPVAVEISEVLFCRVTRQFRV